MFNFRDFTSTGRPPLLVAHRGDQHGAPENTFAAFEQAAALGTAIIELDVQVSRDGVPVVIHDDTLDRTTSGTGPVRERTWLELRQFDAGAWYGEGFAGERVPSLAEVLDWASERPVGLLIELKTSPVFDSRSAEQLAAVLEGRPGGNIVLYSSDHVLMGQLSRSLPGIATGLVINERTPWQHRMLADAGAALLSQSVWVLTEEAVTEAHAHGVLVCSEARYPSDIDMLTAWGVDLIVSTRIPLADLAPALEETRQGI